MQYGTFDNNSQLKTALQVHNFILLVWLLKITCNVL